MFKCSNVFACACFLFEGGSARIRGRDSLHVVLMGSKYALYLEIVLAVRSVQGSCRQYRALSLTSSVMADKVHFEKLG